MQVTTVSIDLAKHVFFKSTELPRMVRLFSIELSGAHNSCTSLPNWRPA